MFGETYKKKQISFVVKEKIDVVDIGEYSSRASQIFHNVIRAKNMTNFKKIPIFYKFGLDKRYSIAATLFVLAMHKKESFLKYLKNPKYDLEKKLEEKMTNINKEVEDLIKEAEKNIESIFNFAKEREKNTLKFKKTRKIEKLNLWKNTKITKEKKSIMKNKNIIEKEIYKIENKLRSNVSNCVSNLIFRGAIFFFSEIKKITKENLITIKDVTKKIMTKEEILYVLQDINLEIKKGEMVAIMGGSGSGKTTLLNILSGLDTATSGDVLFLGKNLTYLTNKHLMKFRQKHVSILFQNFNLLNNINASSNVMVGSSFSNKKIKQKNILEMFKVLGLSGLEKKYPPSLSGGEQQRVALARALLKYPDILFFDEPTASLDRTTGQEILDLLKFIQKKYNTTIVIVTHSPNVARQANRIIKIEKGRIVEIKNKYFYSNIHVINEEINEIQKFDKINNSLYLDNIINLNDNNISLKFLYEQILINEKGKNEKI